MEKKYFPHLNVQTNSNLSFSLIAVSQLVSFWENLEDKLDYLAIADYYPFATANFFQLCKEKKIKPVWGIKVFFQEKSEKKYSATIYPQNSQACKEVITKLFSPISPANRTFIWEYIQNFSKKNCLVVLEAQQIEDISYFVDLLPEILSQPPQNRKIFVGVNFFLTKPSSSLSPKIHSLLLPFFFIKILEQKEEKLLKLWRKNPSSRNFFSPDSQTDFTFYCDTNEYFSHCTNELTFYQMLLLNWQTFLTKIKLDPNYFSRKIRKEKKEDSSLLTLKSQCWQKLLTLPPEQSDRYQKVLQNELAVIEKLDYVDYFLLFGKIVDYLHSKDIIIGPGRGSAVSSLVAYLLGITSIDPLQHNLFFERFLNEKRKSAPDIDLDVENREEVFNYLRNNYSPGQVARIAIRKKIGWKNACLESAKIWQIGETELKQIISFLSETPNLNDLRLQKQKLRYPLFFALVEKIKDLYYEMSIHPSGVIITERSLVGLVPLLSGEKDICLALFEEEQLTQMGLKKYDFLSLKESFGLIADIKSLNFLSEVKGLMQLKLPAYQEVNLNDKKTRELFINFCLTGIFQLDTPAARNLFIRFCPQNFSELVLFLALNRPGARKKVEQIILRKNHQEKNYFTSPLLQEILAETYGFIIFEEQISQLLALIDNCSFAEAEIKRRELAEKGLEENFIARLRKKFSASDSELVYQQIISARGYTFNKAHAVAYSYLTYYIAYLKANFFSELITYFLNEKKEKNLAYLQEAFFYGFQIRKPDINYSQLSWIKKGENLIIGFNGLKECRVDFFTALIEERKKNGVYHDWENFLLRTSEFWKEVKPSNLIEWIKGGIFTSLRVEALILQENSENILRYLRLRQKIPTASNKNLPFLDLPISSEKRENKKIINSYEWESLGIYISYFSRWREIIKNKNLGLTSLLEVFQKYDNREVVINIYVIVSQIEKKNEKVLVLTLQDIRTSFKLEISTSDYQKNQELLAIHNELLLTCQVKIVNKKINSISLKSLSEL
jgi:DNA polymerase-3 subunit alpha